MEQTIVQHLISLNRQFYQSCAHTFSQTRQSVQPGVRRVINAYIPPSSNYQILDVGCGNGDILPALDIASFTGNYLGVDFSTPLLQENKPAIHHFSFSFKELDITTPGWETNLPKAGFDRILCFAVLHHIPSQALQEKILKGIDTLLKPDGIFVISVWQFLRSQRLAKRIQPWHLAGIAREDIDENDYLLDWKANNTEINLRYVHQYTPEEINELQNKSNFECVERFSSDGQEGNLSDYYVFRKMKAILDNP
jgi:tRNA (uracil-5-)-methyltransferase TRM9